MVGQYYDINLMEKEKNRFNPPPIHSLKALNYWRYFSIVALILIALISFILIKYVGFIIAILGLYCISMILFIRFPRIDLYEDHFEIIKKSVYSKLTECVKYNYCDLENVKFSKGFTNWIMIALTFLLTGGWRIPWANEQYSKLDSMILTQADNKHYEINRIGTRDNFIKLIEQIKIKMPSN
ncbi:MAG: hypothetical protein JXA68_05490 [Ignavibacteriales bacterium]|nr:hypothetical protein [Ignavibacteriales bacterium]